MNAERNKICMICTIWLQRGRIQFMKGETKEIVMIHDTVS